MAQASLDGYLGTGVDGKVISGVSGAWEGGAFDTISEYAEAATAAAAAAPMAAPTLRPPRLQSARATPGVASTSAAGAYTRSRWSST